MLNLGLFAVGKKPISGTLVGVLLIELLGVAFWLALLTPLPVLAAQATIATTPNTTAAVHNQLGTTIVFLDDQVGYKFYRFGAVPFSGMCGYSKTTNGGASWGTFVPVDTQTDCIGMQVWFDQWTPGDNGSFVHIVTIDTGDDEMFYNRLNTTNDSLLLTTATTTCLGCAGIYAAGTNLPSITKATNGTLYVSTDDGDGTNIRRCSVNCGVSASWTTVGTPPQGNANSFSLLMPLSADNVMLINRSVGNVLRSSIWNGSAWTAFVTIDGVAVQNTTYDGGIAATVDISNGDIYLAYVTDNNDFVTADHDIRVRLFDGANWLTRTDVLTNVAGRGLLQVAISRDSYRGDIYVTYTARSAIATAASANVFHRRSVDGMITWQAEQGPHSSTSADLYGITANLMSSERIYVTWYNVTLTDVIGNTIADIRPEVLLSARGTQLAQTRTNVPNVYAGGAFVLSALSSHTLSSIIIAENGSINAQTGLSNIELFYDFDTTAPFDCASESFAGTEAKFGATVGSFSGADGSASFTNPPINLGPTQAICFYVSYTVTNSAQNGQTIEIAVANPITDVIVSGGTEVHPTTAVAMAGTTQVVDANLNQFGFHWRLNNGSEVVASSATNGIQNTALTAVQIGAERRIRIGVNNEGSTSTLSSTYTLQYGESTGLCSAVVNWQNVGALGADWLMRDSPHISDGANTTNIIVANGGLTDPPSSAFLVSNGALKDTSATTSAMVILPAQFVEFEYSIMATTTANEGSTYCFRMVRGDLPLSVYTQYPRATIVADVQVQSLGTQIATTAVATANVYSGGAFSIIENSGSRSVNSITVTELGTVNGATGIDNVRLFYDIDTTTPFDCASESYAGTETQFGSTASGGFSGPNESVTFTGAVTISTTATLCVYVVYDVTGSAQNGQIIDIAINSPANDVVVSGGGSVGPSTQINITNTTSIQGPIINQLSYHWRNDNGSETGATSATGGQANVALSEFNINSPIRLRLAVTNTGLTTSVPTRFRLEYAPRITTCDMATVWTDVGQAGDGWDMRDSTFLTNGETTTDISIASGGVNNGTGAFIASNGGVRDTESLSGTTSIPVGNYLDLEYSITSTNFTAYGTTYCFRVTANGTPLATYTNYAEITTSPKRDFRIQRGSVQVSGTSAVVLAGTSYVAPASTSRAFVRITNTHYTGAGHTVAGAQNTDDVTAFISNPGNLATSFTIARPATAINTTRVDWEIIEFIGQPDTDNEIVVRETNTINFTTTGLVATGTVVSGTIDDSKVVVFITGLQNPDPVRNYYASQVTSEWDAATNRPIFRRAAAGAAAVSVSYAVVEFRGVNWNVQRVQHTYTAAGVVQTQAITAVNSLARTFLHTQRRVGATVNVVHFGDEVWLSSIGVVSFQLEAGASVAVEQTSVAWVIENTQTGNGAMRVQRSAGNTTGGTAPLSLSVSFPTPIEALNNTSITGNSRAAGANTTYPRPIAGLLLTSTTTFQIWRSDTGSLLTYRIELIEWPVSDLALRQTYYRFYTHNNALTPSDPWPPGIVDLGENTTITASDEPLGVGDRVRIRMAVRVSNANLPAGLVDFRLQYGLRGTTCSAVSPGSWLDVGGADSGIVWRGFSATGTSNGANLAANPPSGGLLLSVSNVSGSLVHSNPSPPNPFPALDGDYIEYDWHLEHNGALPQSNYCFRMVRGDGTPLEGYNFYPQIRTAGFTPVTRNWRWYSDQQNETPTVPLAAENVAPINIANGDTLALRVTVFERRNVQGNDAKFRLQFSDDPSFVNPVDMVATSSCTAQSLWCYEVGGGADNQTISTRLLSDAEPCVAGVGNGCGRHNSSPAAATGYVHFGNQAREYSFTIRNAAARVKAVYFFRLVYVNDNATVPADGGEVLPSLVTEGPSLNLTVTGLPTGTTTAGVVTNVATIATEIGFGDLTFAMDRIAAHRLTVQTNATEGYQVLKYARQPLLSPNGFTIPAVSGTNAAPTSWAAGCSAAATGCVGYHTTDAVLRGGSTRFAPNDTYAGLVMVPVEVMHSSIPTTDVHDIIYRIRVTETQPAGLYETEIVYIAVPSY